MRKSLIYIFSCLSLISNAQNENEDTGSSPVKPRYFQRVQSGLAVAALQNPWTTKGSAYADSFHPVHRKWIVGAGTAALYGTSFIYLNEAWYKGYPRSSFHIFNDSREWLQMDKIGHVWTAYNISRGNAALWRWSGMTPGTSVLLGSGTSLLYLFSIEYLDGRSAEWGWSWADVVADVSGTVLFASQQLKWNDQSISLKFSAHREKYASGLVNRADDLFGKTLPERLLKDYNGQTYWLSFNLASLFGFRSIPGWFSIAVGYGAQGMLGGHENLAFDEAGNIIFDRRDMKRYRQWYLAPDVDLTRIKTNSRLLRTLFFAFNSVKFPLPALEFSDNRFRFKPLAF